MIQLANSVKKNLKRRELNVKIIIRFDRMSRNYCALHKKKSICIGRRYIEN